MKCFYHPDRDAVGFCDECGKAVCKECSDTVKEKRYCFRCMKDLLLKKGALAAAPGTPEAGKKEKKEKKKTKTVEKPSGVKLISLGLFIWGILSLLTGFVIAYLGIIGMRVTVFQNYVHPAVGVILFLGAFVEFFLAWGLGKLNKIAYVLFLPSLLVRPIVLAMIHPVTLLLSLPTGLLLLVYMLLKKKTFFPKKENKKAPKKENKQDEEKQQNVP